MNQYPNLIQNQTFHSLHLSNHIGSYRIYHFDAHNSNNFVHFLPEGIIEIIFQLSLSTASRSKDSQQWQKRPQAFVGGLHNNAYRLRFSDRGVAFGVRFLAGSFANFTSMPVHFLKNQLLNPAELWGKEGQLWVNGVLTATNHQHRILLSENFLKKQFRSLSQFPSLSICKYIQQEKGHIQIRQLATRFHFSSARFRQLFNERVGISPKGYCRIQRIKYALQQQPLETSLTNWAYQLGYFDQAHFSNDIKQITGLSPKECKEIIFY